MEELLNTFIQTIKDAQHAAGLTQEGLAEQPVSQHDTIFILLEV